jgi:ATP-dependent protease ClpP protease subunit
MIDRSISIATVIFDDEITHESITKLISSIEIMFNEGFDKVNLYFSSIGGSGSYAYLLIDYLNDNVDRISLKIFGNIFSAGVWIAKYSKCPKEVLPEIDMMIHKANILDGNFKDLDKISNSSTWAVDQLNKDSNKKFYSEIESFLIDKEKELYLKNDDVYIIDQKRIKKIIAG